ncbi:MAG: hypothetical protein HY867_03895 [Chloroflexi bacterium]|nr:hypothetical protein [Chloroflexota bacterium]
MQRKFAVILLALSLTASACQASTPIPAATDTVTSIPIATQTPLPPPTPTSLPTEVPYYLNVTVWTEEPRVPMLAYHQMAPDISEYSTGHKVRASDLRAQLEGLNEAGFTLVAAQDWINGNLSVPRGRRPLIISMDDLFFNNQITLGADGVPTTDTSIGIFWQFAQERPEFGFRLALFASLGDKLYAEPDYPDWDEKLGRAIAWCLDHGAEVYNHTYSHSRLDLTDPPGVKSELRKNDLYLRELLTMIGREDLIPKLGNMLALPYGHSPDANGTYVMQHYANPEGLAMQAIYVIDNNERAGFVPPPYSSRFDRFNIPRIAARPVTVQYLLDHKDDFPAAESCQLGPLDPVRLADKNYIAAQIELMTGAERCPTGIYALNGWIFDARADSTALIFP